MLLQVFLDTMKRHANHTEVILQASTALGSLSKNAANRVAIIAQGGVAASRDLKRNHPGNSEIQKIADNLLALLR